jgi:hypothetical protein
MSRPFLGSPRSSTAETSDHGGQSSCEGEEGVPWWWPMPPWHRGSPWTWGKANGSAHLVVTVWLPHAASLAYGLPCMLLTF